MSFSKDFIWGAATSAYQIEGAYNEDGKGESIWDVLSRKKGATMFGENGDIACEHYKNYKDDIKLMKEMGLKYYRFSINWTRVLPEGIGKINWKGLDFYSDLVDELIKNNIEPMVTLFHWDYPFELYKKGGWLNGESVNWFLEFTKVIVDKLSDRVKYWITINEPQIFTGLGHQLSEHAPFLKMSRKELIIISHNVLLSHGYAVKYIRENAIRKPVISFAPTGPVYIPKDNSEEAISEAKAKSFSLGGDEFALSITWWSDPVILGAYPKEAYELFGNDMPDYNKEEMEIISQPLDFYAVNIYTSLGDEGPSGYPENMWQGRGLTSMEWVVAPEVLYWAPKFLYERYGLPILISENGVAGNDWVHLDGCVHDLYRIDFLNRYLIEYKKAAEDGVDLMGYLQWSLMDNFEWGQGYNKRFGLIYVDYQTQKRTIKDAGYWYKKVIESNGENL